MLPNIKAGNVCSLPARTPTSWSREEGKGVCVYAKNVRKERETQCRKGGGGGGGGGGGESRPQTQMYVSVIACSITLRAVGLDDKSSEVVLCFQILKHQSECSFRVTSQRHCNYPLSL